MKPGDTGPEKVREKTMSGRRNPPGWSLVTFQPLTPSGAVVTALYLPLIPLSLYRCTN